METVFLTGGSGTIGSAFISRYYDQYKFVSYSRNEKMQVALKRRFPEIEIILGSVEDKLTLNHSVKKTKPNVMLHAAAMKHVDSAERQPTAAIKSNVIGSLNVIETAVENDVAKTIGISTDKACQADNSYGHTKSLMEKMFLENDSVRNRFVICRFGNVALSHGSVIPFWLNLEEQGKPLLLTDEKMNRLIMLPDDAAKLIFGCLEALNRIEQPFIFTKRMKSVNMSKLANLISSRVEVIGLRDGEKLDEVLLSEQEARFSHQEGEFVSIYGRKPSKSPPISGEYSSKNAQFMNENEMKFLIDFARSYLGDSRLGDKSY